MIHRLLGSTATNRVLALSVAYVFAAYSGCGVTRASDNGGIVQPLSFGAGARGLGMGRAQIGVCDDDSALFWNPAGLDWLQRGSVSASFQPLAAGATESGVSAAWRTVDVGSLGVGAIVIRAAGLRGRDDDGNETGAFGATTSRYALGYAPPGFAGVVVGVAGMLDTYRFGGLIASAYSAVAGARWDPAFAPGFAVGAVCREMTFSALRIGAAGDRAPVLFEGGVAYGHRLSTSLRGRLTWAVDAAVARGAVLGLRGGLEYRFLDRFAVRAGWDGTAPTAGVRAGVGPVAIDVAVASTDLGASFRATLSAAFGTPRTEALELRSSLERERLQQEQDERRRATEEQIRLRLAEQLERDRMTATRSFLREGVKLHHAGRLDEAAQSFQLALAWDPGNKTGEQNLKLAQAAIEDRVAAQRRKIARHVGRGRAELRAGRYSDAVGEFGIACALDPSNAAWARENAAAMQAWQREISDAQDPDLSAAISAFANGDLVVARACVRRCLVRHPSNEAALALRERVEQSIASRATTPTPEQRNRAPAYELYRAGVGHYGNRDFREAARKFREAIATDASFREAAEALRRTEHVVQMLDQTSVSPSLR